MAQKTNVKPDMATCWFNSMLYKYNKLDVSELFTVNDCENAHNERQTKCFIDISNQMFYTRPIRSPTIYG